MLSGYYKNNTQFGERVSRSEHLRKKYPDRLPCLLECGGKEPDTSLSQANFLVPKDKTFGEFAYSIRSKMTVKSSQSLFFFVNNKIPVFSKTFSEIYSENKDLDGFLYIVVSAENCFGSKYLTD
jgi:GABA(A) receptor-associated protein